MPKKSDKKQQHSNRFLEVSKTIEKDKQYDLVEALALVKKNATAKFVEGVDLSIKLGVDPKKGDQNVRGTTTLPHGTGKVKVVAVLAKGDQAKEAEAAGADFVGDEDLIKRIQEGDKTLKFDVILATEEMAPQIGKIGKALGAKTPNKRNGTVTNSIATAVKEIKGATRVEYRADKGGVVNMPLGKVNFTDEQLTENFQAAVNAVVKAKPASMKGKYIVTMTLTSTMGPGVALEPLAVQKAAGLA